MRFQSFGTVGPPGVRLVAPWSPDAPRPALPASAPAASSPAAAPPPAAAAASSPPQHVAEPVFDFPVSQSAATHNAWQAQTAERAAKEYARASGGAAMPQGETQLVHAWAAIVRSKRIPTRGCTIWLCCTDQPQYEFWVPGHAVESTSDGAFPDRALYEYVMRCRRKPDVAERFVGRIEAPASNGAMVVLGGGELYLPPRPIEAPNPGTPWAQPQAYGGGAGYGAPPWGAPPWSAPSSWGPWGPPPPPWMMGMGGAYGAPPGLMPYQFQPPPPAVQNDPNKLDLWLALQKGQIELAKVMQDNARAAQPAPAAPVDPFQSMERAVDMIGKLNGLIPKAAEAPAAKGGINIHNVDGTKIVEDKNGDFEPIGTAAIAIKDAVTQVMKGRQAAAAAKQVHGMANGAQVPGMRNGTH